MSKFLFLSDRYHSLKRVAVLMSGATFGQVIQFISYPVLSRLYSPADFGVFGLYMTIAGILGVLVSGAYEQAIVLPAKDEDAFHLLILSVLITVISCSVLFALSLIINSIFSEFLNENGLVEWLYFISPTVLFISISQTLNYWLNRNNLFSQIAVSKIILAASTVLINLAWGVFQPTAMGLIFGSFLGIALSSLFLIFFTLLQIRKINFRLYPMGIWNQAKKYINFPKFTLVHSLFDGMRDGAVTFLVTFLFGPTIYGYYSFATRVTRTPLSLLSYSISQVFYQRSARVADIDKRKLPDLLVNLLKNLVMVSLIPLALLLFWGPQLFSFLFGVKWAEAGYYAQILAPWIVVSFIATSIGGLPHILMKQKPFALIGIGYSLAAPSVLFWFARHFGDIHLALVGFSVFSSVYLLVYILWIIVEVQKGVS